MLLPKQHLFVPSVVVSVLPAYSGTRDVKMSYEMIQKVKMENNYHFSGAEYLCLIFLWKRQKLACTARYLYVMEIYLVFASYIVLNPNKMYEHWNKRRNQMNSQREIQ